MEVRQYCTLPEFTLTPNKTGTDVIPLDQARTVFTPHGYNCTSRSLGSRGPPVWEVSGFSFRRTWNGEWAPGGFQDQASFTYNNTAVNSDWPMLTGDRLCYDLSTQELPAFNGSQQLRCSSGPRDILNFNFDYSRSTLTLSQVWGCDGSDRVHA